MNDFIKEQQAVFSDALEILKAIWASPVVKSIIVTLLFVLKQQAEKLLPVVIKEVETVGADTSLTGEQKMAKVLADLKAAYPGVAENTLRSFIELAVMQVTNSSAAPTTSDTPAVPSA